MANKSHKDRLTDCEKGLYKLNAKMSAILWFLGIVMSLGITNLIMGLR